MAICVITDCDRPGRGGGLCQTHWMRRKRTGSTDLSPRPSNAERFWRYVDRTGDCWEWTGGRLNDGYGAFWANGGQQKAHRFSWTLHFGPIPTDGWVLHRCDNPPCVRPDHLFLGDLIANEADKDAKRRRRIHDEHPSHKLTSADVRVIRERRASGALYRELAAEFGVTIAAVRFAATGQTWRHVV